MRAGGPYYLISRTLGAELGGAIGMLLVFEHTVAAVYYLATISEVLFLANSTVWLWILFIRRLTHLQDPASYVFDQNTAVIVSTVFLAMCTVFSLLGLRPYSVLAVFLFIVKMVAVLCAMFGFLIRPGYGSPGQDCEDSMGCFTGPNLASFRSNLMPKSVCACFNAHFIMTLPSYIYIYVYIYIYIYYLAHIYIYKYII